MAVEPAFAGTCQRCGQPVGGTSPLIRYERKDGPAAYATCPSCDAVVRLHAGDADG